MTAGSSQYIPWLEFGIGKLQGFKALASLEDCSLSVAVRKDAETVEQKIVSRSQLVFVTAA
jgi:hypothetical protein